MGQPTGSDPGIFRMEGIEAAFKDCFVYQERFR